MRVSIYGQVKGSTIQGILLDLYIELLFSLIFLYIKELITRIKLKNRLKILKILYIITIIIYALSLTLIFN